MPASTSRLPPHAIALGFATLLMTATSARADLFIVGSGLGCTHATVQEAVTAANANDISDTIRVTRSQDYTAQQIVITTSRNLDLVGGFDTCTSAAPGAFKTTLSGADGAAAAVLTLQLATGSTVRLRQLRVTGGDSNGGGGGIRYGGGGLVELIDSEINSNSADVGGGIWVRGNGGSPHLVIGRDTEIAFNTARSGGGIYLENAYLTMNAPGSTIYANVASETGGGLRLHGSGFDTIATIGSEGRNNTAAIHGNQAAIGGGAALYGLDENIELRLVSVDPARPASIKRNIATVRGGAIDLQPDDGGFMQLSFLRANLIDAVLEENSAPYAAAVYLGNYDEVSSAALYLEDSRIVNHVSEDSASIPTAGPIIVVTEFSWIHSERSKFQGNLGGPLLLSGGAAFITITDSLISGNQSQGGLLQLDFPSQHAIYPHISGSTIADNVLGAAPVLKAAERFELLNSIVWQPGRTTLDAPDRFVDDVLASEIASLGASDSIVMAPPRFVDPAHGDYRLQAASPAVDFTGIVSGAGIDGVGRGVDLARVANYHGPGDIGAYERPALGNLVLNPGFAEDTRLWSAGTPGSSATWVAPGTSSSSVTLSMQSPPGGQFHGLKQCIRIPGPGAYRLTGGAYGSGPDFFTRDIVSLRWILRADSGGEDCTGSISAQGEVAFPSASTWQLPVAPAIIDVSSLQWTNHTNVEVFLQVREGSLNINATTGYFDNITLEAIELVSGLPFADGFE